MVFTASLLGAQQSRDSVENKLSCCVLGQDIYGMPSSLCGRQMVGPTSLAVVVAKDLQAERER